MIEIEFNLLDEPWIIVLKEDGTTEEMSITEIFRQAHNIKSIAGETPTQNIAIMRVLLAIIYAVYYRIGLGGEVRVPEDEDEAVDIWTGMWKKNKFDTPCLEDYLKLYYERFWLFHPKVPFYQAKIDKGTIYNSPKLIGDLSESGNKPRLFGNRSGTGKSRIDYGEAARWLIHLNAFDDTSSKPSVRGAGFPSPGVGWLGKLGIIYPEGKNLFETLMFNFVMTDHNGEPFPNGEAIWEIESRVKERIEIPTPESPIEILTLQSRRILLERSGLEVTGYLLMGGDIVQRENALVEQMTVWRKNDDSEWIPKRHDPARFLWRDFSAIASKSEGMLKPGVVRWTSALIRKEVFPYDHVTFRTCGIKYASKDFYAENLISDGMAFSSKLLSETGETWNSRISDALQRTDKCIRIFGNYVKELSIEGGNAPKGDNAKSTYESGKELAYYTLDEPFRDWLYSINPGIDDEEIKLGEWMDKIYSVLVGDLGKRLLRESGVKALVGRDMNNNSISKFRFLRNGVRKAMRGE